MKRKWAYSLVVVLVLLACLAQPAVSQAEEYTVHVRKDFGYGWGSDIQGRFTISLMGDEEDIAQVTFYLDDEVLAEMGEPPFRFQFQTDDYEPGQHSLFAEVKFADGSVQSTPAVSYRFISSTQAHQQLSKVLLWIGGALVGTLVLVAVIQALFFKRKKTLPGDGGKRDYGLLGGTICPKCGHPFSRHFWGINLLAGRLDRCEHCGRWVMTRRASSEELRSAEKDVREKAQAEKGIPPVQRDERDLLEKTKYIDDL